jgi:hypothetical protein
MKALILGVAVLAFAGTAANAWTDGRGHWFEGPVGPYGDPPVGYRFEAPPAYGYPPPVYAPGYYPPPVVVVPPPTDAQVIAGTILGIAGMFARPHYRGW